MKTGSCRVRTSFEPGRGVGPFPIVSTQTRTRAADNSWASSRLPAVGAAAPSCPIFPVLVVPPTAATDCSHRLLPAFCDVLNVFLSLLDSCYTCRNPFRNAQLRPAAKVRTCTAAAAPAVGPRGAARLPAASREAAQPKRESKHGCAMIYGATMFLGWAAEQSYSSTVCDDLEMWQRQAAAATRLHDQSAPVLPLLPPHPADRELEPWARPASAAPSPPPLGTAFRAPTSRRAVCCRDVGLPGAVSQQLCGCE